jgi:hypothetical protein
MIKYYLFKCGCIYSCEDGPEIDGEKQYRWSVVFVCGEHSVFKLTTATHRKGPEYYSCRELTKLEATIIKMKGDFVQK